MWDFNPRSPRGERLIWRSNSFQRIVVFQSTLPARGATRIPGVMPDNVFIISIHAPREGSDAYARRHAGQRFNDFNPRSPRGERLTSPSTAIMRVLFQSTLPARGATYSNQDIITVISYFNPRSPRGERLEEAAMPGMEANFNPRSPRGERQQTICENHLQIHIQTVRIILFEGRCQRKTGNGSCADTLFFR